MPTRTIPAPLQRQRPKLALPNRPKRSEPAAHALTRTLPSRQISLGPLHGHGRRTCACDRASSVTSCRRSSASSKPPGRAAAWLSGAAPHPAGVFRVTQPKDPPLPRAGVPCGGAVSVSPQFHPQFLRAPGRRRPARAAEQPNGLVLLAAPGQADGGPAQASLLALLQLACAPPKAPRPGPACRLRPRVRRQAPAPRSPVSSRSSHQSPTHRLSLYPEV